MFFNIFLFCLKGCSETLSKYNYSHSRYCIYNTISYLFIEIHLKFVMKLLVLIFHFGRGSLGWWSFGRLVGGRWSVAGGRLVGGFKKTPLHIYFLRKLDYSVELLQSQIKIKEMNKTGWSFLHK